MKLNIQLFANNSNDNNDYIFLRDLYPEWKNTLADFRPYEKIYYKQDIQNNTTTFKVEMYGQILDVYHLIMAPNYAFVSNIAGQQKAFNGTVSAVGVTSNQLIHLGTHERTFEHNPDGTPKSFVNFQTGGSSIVDGEAETNVFVSDVFQYYAPTIPRGSILGDISRFNVENEITIPITKYLSEYYDKLIVKIGDNIIKTVENIEDGDTLQFSSEELSNIYEIMTSVNETNFSFILSTYTDSEFETQLGTSSTKTVKGYIENANPIFSNFAYEDSNSVIVALTGSNQKIVKGHSDLKITINGNNKATAQKGATIEYYKINNDAYTYNDDFTKTIENYDLNNVVVYAIDSRGNSTSKTIVFNTFIEYAEPNIGNTLDLDRTGGINEETTMEFQGTYWNNNFGTSTNDITATYQYKEKGSSEYINGISTLTLTKNGANISLEQAIKGDLATGFDTTKQYDIKLILTDSIDSYLFYGSVAVGKPAIDIYENNVAFGGGFDTALVDGSNNVIPVQIKDKCDFASEILLDGKNLIDLIYPIGRGFIDFTDTDYSSYLGLTWEAELVGMFPVGYDISQSEFNEVGKIGGALNHFHTLSDAWACVSNLGWLYSKQKLVSQWIANHVATNTNNLGSSDGPSDGVELGGKTDKSSNLPPYKVVRYWKRTE